MPTPEYDVVVIGSGFGGSVMTCRLAEKGYSVCLLERGGRYAYASFPRHTFQADRFLWDPEDGSYGLYDFNVFQHSDATVACASGLGGGSLVYANVLMKVAPAFFATWPGGITREVMDPFYDSVLTMMEASPYPFSDPFYADTPKTQLIKKAFEGMDHSADAGTPEWVLPDLAIRFKGEFPGAQSLNNQGKLQSRCTKCGECVIGCNIHAKNTLDINYIARAESQNLLGSAGHAATVNTNSEVVDIVPQSDGGYVVCFHDPQQADSPTQEVRCRKVIVSAGSFGSTALLLKLKHKGSLPNLSDQLGRNWCGNGDLEGSILDLPDRANPTIGPTITSAIACRFPDYPDGFPHGLTIQDGGFPSIFAWYIVGKMPSPSAIGRFFKYLKRELLRLFNRKPEQRYGDEIASIMFDDDYIAKMLVLLGMGRDRSNGVLQLDSEGEVELHWRMEQGSELHFQRLRGEMGRMADALGGKFVDSPLTHFDKVIAVHPLGGCIMGDSADTGVVDTSGEAFGHPGLYVVDGSILPSSTGVNPSLTIAANAERIAARFPERSADGGADAQTASAPVS